MLPPGRARLAMNPLPTGSSSTPITMGITAVASLAERVAAGPTMTITFTLRRASSAASSFRRSSFSSAYRCSMLMFLPSTYPSSRRPCRSASMRVEAAEGEAVPRNPILGTFAGWCACATAPPTTSTNAMTASPSDFRFWILDFRLSDRELEDRIQILSCICFSPKSKIGNRKSKMSSYDSIRPCEHVRRYCQSDLLRRFEINDEIKFFGLFHGKVSRLCAFKNLIRIGSGAAVQIGNACRVGHKTPGEDKFLL